MKAEYMTDVEQTIYAKEFMQCKRVKVITRSGHLFEGRLSCDGRFPGGIWIQEKEDDKPKSFIPFSAIDGIQVLE